MKKQTTTRSDSKHFSPEAVRRIVETTWRLGEPLCAAEGMELVHVECQRESHGRILRLYIDKPGGVLLDDCVNVSRQMGDLLDVQADVEGAYSLEVSSPGPNRPLGRLQDFERFKGQRAKVTIDPPIAGQKQAQGVIADVVEDQVVIASAVKTIAIPMRQIKRARLIHINGED